MTTVKNVYTVFNFGQKPTIAFALPSNPSLLKIGSVPTSNALTASGEKVSSPIYITVVDSISQGGSVPLNVVTSSSGKSGFVAVVKPEKGKEVKLNKLLTYY